MMISRTPRPGRLAAIERPLVISLLLFIITLFLIPAIRLSQIQNISTQTTKEPISERQQNFLEFRLEGAVVNPGKTRLPVGSRICDLKKQGLVLSNSNKKYLKSRRKIKEGEIIYISYN